MSIETTNDLFEGNEFISEAEARSFAVSAANGSSASTRR